MYHTWVLIPWELDTCSSCVHAARSCFRLLCELSYLHTYLQGWVQQWPEASWHHQEGILTSHRLLIARSFTQSLSLKHQVDLYVCTSLLMFNYLKHSNIHTALERNPFSLCSELWMHVFHNQPERPAIGEMYIWEAHERPSHTKIILQSISGPASGVFPSFAHWKTWLMLSVFKILNNNHPATLLECFSCLKSPATPYTSYLQYFFDILILFLPLAMGLSSPIADVRLPQGLHRAHKHLPGTESEVPLAEKSQGIQTSNYELDSDVFSVLKQLWGFHGVTETCDFPHISKEENSPCKAAPQHGTATTSDPKKTAGTILQKTHSSQHSCSATWWWAPRWGWSTANRKGSVSAHLRFNFPFFTLLATKHCGSGTLGEALQRGMNNISCLPSPDCCLLDFKWAHPTQQLSHKIRPRLFSIVIITFLLLNFQTCSLGPIPCSCEKRQMKWKAVTILR